MSAIRPSFKARNIAEDDEVSELDESIPFVELFQTLEARRGSGVSDARDMISGHLGLTSPFTQGMIGVDYSKPIEKLYEEIARKHIEANKNTSIIYHVETVHLRSRRKDLPSWLPDWEVAIDASRSYPSRRDEAYYSRVFKPRDVTFHTEFRSGCDGCIKPFPGVVGLVGWDLGPVASILPATSFRNLPKVNSLESSLAREE